MSARRTSLPFVERAAETAVLRDAVTAAIRGEGAAVLVEGPPGIGKSRLLDEALAGAAGGRVVRGRCGPLMRHAPYGLALELLAPLVDGRDRPLSPRAARAWAAVDGSSLTPADRFAVAFGLYWLLQDLLADGPAVLAVDDGQWADEPSMQWLAYCAARLEGLSACLVIAARAGEGGTALGELRRAAGVRTVAPAPLSRDGVAALLSARHGTPPDAETVAACHAATAGLPLYVHEVAAGQKLDVAVGVRGRLERLDPPVRAFAEAAAVLDDGALIRDAASLAGLAEDVAAAAADRLTDVAILDTAVPVRFAHPLVREAVVDALGPGRRAVGHARAAAILHARGAPAARVATHLLAAEPAGEAWRAAVLHAAAAQAMAAGSPREAAALLERALDEPPAAATRPLVLRDLGLARTLLGDAGGAAALREALPGLGTPRERGEAARLLARALLHGDELDEAVGVLCQLADAIDPENDRDQRLLVEGDLCGVALQRASTVGLALERATRFAPGLTALTPGERVLTGALAAALDSTGEPASVTWPLARTALGDGRLALDQLPDGPVFYLCCDLAVDGEHYDVVEPALDIAIADARARGSIAGFVAASTFRAHTFMTRGRLAEAEAEARSAVQGIAEGSWTPLAPLAQGTLLGILADRGDLAAGDAAVALAPDPGEESRLSGFVLYHRARLRLAQARPGDARRDLRELGRRIQHGGLANQHWPWRALLARALGPGPEAERLAREEVELRASFSARWQVTAHRALGLVVGGDEGLAHLEHAAALAATAPARHDHAATLVDLGAALRRRRRVSEAREPLALGLELATGCGALGLADRARVELRQAGLRPRRAARSGLASLTASELRVARMAADGATNAEIAQALFVTVKTVEKHLSGAYAKLGATRRDLARELERA